ncbi:UNVERIFIED_CONTAM: hypothetical protein PYX00_003578 [Menopon gallinae]|uniref:Uncharacterized protein n=1 Tax=Menopon gallinae TaxID=328185 RepID=A0AAW2I1P1_9NEOP
MGYPSGTIFCNSLQTTRNYQSCLTSSTSWTIPAADAHGVVFPPGAPTEPILLKVLGDSLKTWPNHRSMDLSKRTHSSSN